MAWRMQIKTSETDGWLDIRPVNGDPYEYETKEEADRMLRICYPEVVRGFFDNCAVRSIEV